MPGGNQASKLPGLTGFVLIRNVPQSNEVNGREDLGLFSGGLREVSIEAIS